MKIRTENRTVEITLKLWRGGWNAGFEPDCFDDLEPNFPSSHQERTDDDCIIAPEADTAELIAWWTAECNNANRGQDGDGLAALTEQEIEQGDEWVLTAEEVAL